MINLRNLHKTFENNAVLRGIHLDIATGESMVVIGASGSGKSVMLKCILGLMTPDTGTIIIDGQTATPANRDTFMAGFGMLFQGAALFDSMPVWQNVAFRMLRHLPRKDARALAIAKLARVGLDADTADRLPAELSGGMQKRVGLARAIAGDPKVIFFDEPTTGLDPIRAGTINALIREVVTDLGVTAVTITHDMTSVHAIGDRVAMLQNGAICWTGTPAEMARSDNAYLRQFIAGADGPTTG